MNKQQQFLDFLAGLNTLKASDSTTAIEKEIKKQKLTKDWLLVAVLISFYIC
jgi:ABC-type transport system involved in cytochrome bd biosynthesis fused ATPase/permease subunit